MKLLVGITGAARTGKTTAASVLADLIWGADNSGVSVGVRGFADPLKRGVGAMLGVDATSDAFKRSEVLPGITGRRVLEVVGTEALRHLDPDFWVKLGMRDLDDVTIFTDVRFPNEARAIKDRGGIVVRTLRPPSEFVPTGHASTVPIRGSLIDFQLDNTGPMADSSRASWVRILQWADFLTYDLPPRIIGGVCL